MSDSSWRLHSVLAAALLVSWSCTAEPGAPEIEPRTSALRGGSNVPAGQHQAVVSLSTAAGTVFCSGTMISDRLVLTAAHCLRPGCGTQALGGTVNVSFVGVSPGPGPFHCSNNWTDQTVAGTWVGVHPDYCRPDTFSNDYALIRLSQPASSVVCVAPFQISAHRASPSFFFGHILVGFGGNASGCNPESAGLGTKRHGLTSLDRVLEPAPQPLAGTTYEYEDSGLHTCPGDSGGPALGLGGLVEGIASSVLIPKSRIVAGYRAMTWMGVTVFDGPNHNGAGQAYVAGSYDHTAMNVVPNDRISSMKIAPGFEVQLWAESGAWGDTAIYTGDVPFVNSVMDDRASHLAVRPGVTVYRDAGFTGVAQTFTAGAHDVGALNVVGNDQTSSLAVAPGMKVTACTEAGFWNCQSYTGYVANLGGFNDHISSLIVEEL